MADFYIQTDKEFYFAGDTVNGYIYVNIHTPFPQATGISMKFTGYECVKWLTAQELHRPRPNPHRKPNQPPPHDPIAAIPPHELHHSNTNTMEISDVQSEDDRSYDHRPKYIKTPSDRYFRMSYHETRNMFTKNNAMIYQCQGLAPGQYSFPFCFKTFEGWPASFDHITPQKKGVIVYNMTVAIEPSNRKAQCKFSRQISIRETRWLSSQHKKSEAEITSCCCCNQGPAWADMHFEKDGFMPGDTVQSVLEIDNSLCAADMPTIRLSVDYTVSMKSDGASTADHGTIFSKNINGMKAGQSAKGNDAIRDSFNLNSNREIKPTCSGKLLSNQYSINVVCIHDISCDCCSDRVSTSVPIIIFPVIRTYAMPSAFQTGWSPQVMPQYDMALQNSFQNNNLANMGQQQQYPQQQQQGYPPQQQQGYPPQQQQGYPPQQQQGYPPQQHHEQTMSQLQPQHMQMQEG